MSRMDRDFVVSQFTRYVQGFDQEEEGVRLKYAHSLRVSGLCEQIALSLDLSQDDVDLAWLIGVLHDIGRFEQLREYHTFVDYRSMDHAKYGAHYLFADGHIRDFLDDMSQDNVICMAIDQHNVYQLRRDLTPRQQLFCQLIVVGIGGQVLELSGNFLLFCFLTSAAHLTPCDYCAVRFINNREHH